MVWPCRVHFSYSLGSSNKLLPVCPQATMAPIQGSIEVKAPPPYAWSGLYSNNKISRLNIRPPPPFKQALIFRIIVPICFAIAHTHI